MNVLAIGAHFDDVELGCGGALAKHVKNGDNVIVYVATVSGYSNANNDQVRSNEVAKYEAQNAMSTLGVNKLVCGQFPTLNIEFTDDLNKEIIKLIEDNNIDRVYTHWTGDVHHDHQSVAKASLHSSRHVAQVLMYRSNWYDSSEQFRGNYYVDISDFWDVKRRAVQCHTSELERTANKWISFFNNEAINCGQRVAVERAESFEIVKMLEITKF